MPRQNATAAKPAHCFNPLSAASLCWTDVREVGVCWYSVPSVLEQASNEEHV